VIQLAANMVTSALGGIPRARPYRPASSPAAIVATSVLKKCDPQSHISDRTRLYREREASMRKLLALVLPALAFGGG
jgi:hypothetical protein